MACDMELQVGWAALRRAMRSIDVEGQASTTHEIHLQIRVLPILDDAQMRLILKQVLKERGWKESSDGSLSQQIGEATATVSADGKEVSLSLQKTTKIIVKARVEVKPDSSESELQKAASSSAKEEISSRTAAAKKQQEEEALLQLTRLEPELRSQLQSALNQVYKRALEEKAAQLGNLESSLEKQDDNGSYEVTVVVRA
jgi:hypothetical protein